MSHLYLVLESRMYKVPFSFFLFTSGIPLVPFPDDAWPCFFNWHPRFAVVCFLAKLSVVSANLLKSGWLFFLELGVATVAPLDVCWLPSKNTGVKFSV